MFTKYPIVHKNVHTNYGTPKLFTKEICHSANQLVFSMITPVKVEVNYAYAVCAMGRVGSAWYLCIDYCLFAHTLQGLFQCPLMQMYTMLSAQLLKLKMMS